MAIGGNLIVSGTSNRTAANATGGMGYTTISGTKYALVVGGGLTGVDGGNIFNIDGKGGATDDHYVRFNTLSTNTAASNGSSGLHIGNPPSNNSKKYLNINSTDQAAATIQNTTALVDFAAAFVDFRNKRTVLCAKSNNVTTIVSGGQATITLGNNTTNVWNVTGATLNSYSQITLSGNLPSATKPLLINVDAAGIYNWNNLKFLMGSENDNYMEINRAPYILWNFYNTTTLNISNANLILGSILAPDAAVSHNAAGNITGQVIVKNYTKPNAGEFHIAIFNASISTGVLPLHSISLSTLLSNDNIAINWQTINETNVHHFEIERSTDGKSFVTIGSQTSNNINGTNGVYTFNESAFNIQNTAIVYYRIKVIDINGAYTYSTISMLKLNKNSTLSVTNNLFVNYVTFNYNASSSSTIQVSINNFSGNRVFSKSTKVSKGINSLTIDNLDIIPSGAYILAITDVSNMQTAAIKIIK